jgi:hypothetical protein
MTSILIIETGEGVENANSYASATAIRDFALTRGVVLAPSDDNGDALVDQMAIKAMDYIEVNRNQFWGSKLSANQRLSFPRINVPADASESGLDYAINGFENLRSGQPTRPASPIPLELVQAQCALVMQIKSGVDLLPTQASGKFVKKQKIGPLEREFSETVGIMALPRMPMIDALLASLLRPSGAMTTYRK